MQFLQITTHERLHLQQYVSLIKRATMLSTATLDLSLTLCLNIVLSSSLLVWHNNRRCIASYKLISRLFILIVFVFLWLLCISATCTVHLIS